MKNKGYALSSIVYPLLLICLTLILSILFNLDNKRNLLETLKKEVTNEVVLCDYNAGQTWTYNYTGGVQTFTVPCDGTYQLEVWGAQGGYRSNLIGGYGGYSVGNITLTKDILLYVNVGGQGSSTSGGYNGGGSHTDDSWGWDLGAGGGGATHIAKDNNRGLLSNYSSYPSEVLIVAGGGGGTGGGNSNYSYNGGSGGGYIGVSINKSTGGTQTSGGKNALGTIDGSFGQGGPATNEGGGGSGYYGGGSGKDNTVAYGGAGGSGYIGNPLLFDKVMYCYNCASSNEVSTKTISTTCTNSIITESCAKKGNGYARITLVSISS